uniref:Uncharacterized protein n=1 Tax=Strongyloides venezuelensis TaxID=75913 RepID=A0A0K0FN78_STRVS
MVVGRTAAFAKRRQSFATSHGSHSKTSNAFIAKRTSDNDEIESKTNLKKNNKKRQSVVLKKNLSTVTRYDGIRSSGGSKYARRHSKLASANTRNSFDFATAVIQAARRASEANPHNRELNSTEKSGFQKNNYPLCNNLYENYIEKSEGSLKSNSSSINLEASTYVNPWRRR